MKRTVFLLMLALCVSAACARADRGCEWGGLYDGRDVYGEPELISGHLAT